MTYTAVVAVTEDGRVAILADFSSEAEAAAHVATHGGFVVPTHPGSVDQWLVDPETGAVSVVDPGPPVPEKVTPLQARRALRQEGLHTAVAGWLDDQPEEVREAWEYAVEVRRTDPIITSALAALNLTEADRDNLFRIAATL